MKVVGASGKKGVNLEQFKAVCLLLPWMDRFNEWDEEGAGAQLLGVLVLALALPLLPAPGQHAALDARATSAGPWGRGATLVPSSFIVTEPCSLTPTTLLAATNRLPPR